VDGIEGSSPVLGMEKLESLSGTSLFAKPVSEDLMGVVSGLADAPPLKRLLGLLVALSGLAGELSEFLTSRPRISNFPSLAVRRP